MRRHAPITGTLRLRVGLDNLLQMSLDEARAAVDFAGAAADLGDTLLPPVDSQEVWAAGVTYERSRAGRVEESTEAGVYDRVYRRPADRRCSSRPPPQRVVADGEPVGIRADSPWNAPEPELGLVLNASGDIFGYVVGNDVSSRSIEGENPLYLPQAKVYDRSCSLGQGSFRSGQPRSFRSTSPSACSAEMRSRTRGRQSYGEHHPAVRGSGRVVDGRADLPGRRDSAYRHRDRARRVFHPARWRRRHR